MISDDKNSSNSWQETLNAYRDKVARSSSCEELEEAACDLDLCLIPGDRIPYLDTAWALYNTITANPGIDDLQLTTGIISRIWAILADEEADNNALGAEFIHYWQRLCQDASKLHLPRCISLPNRDILDIFKAHVDLWKHTTNSIVARVIHEYHAAGIKTTKDKLLLNAMWSHLLAMADLYSRISSTDYYHQESLLECACQLISTLDASDLAVFGLVLRRSLPDAGQKRTDYTKHKCHEIVINLAGHFIALDDAEKFRVFKEWQSQFVPLLRNYEPRQWRRRCTTDLSATLYFDVAPDTPITGQVFNVTQNGKDILLRLGNEYPFCASNAYLELVSEPLKIRLERVQVQLKRTEIDPTYRMHRYAVFSLPSVNDLAWLSFVNSCPLDNETFIYSVMKAQSLTSYTILKGLLDGKIPAKSYMTKINAFFIDKQGYPSHEEYGGQVLLDRRGCSVGSNVWKEAESQKWADELDKVALDSAIRYLETASCEGRLDGLNFVTVNIHHDTILSKPPWLVSSLLRLDNLNLGKIEKYIEIRAGAKPVRLKDIEDICHFAGKCKLILDDVGKPSHNDCYVLLGMLINQKPQRLAGAKIDKILWERIKDPASWKWFSDLLTLNNIWWVVEGIENSSDLDTLCIMVRDVSHKGVFVEGHAIGIHNS